MMVVVCDLLYCYHNLALYAAKDWEGFEEAAFWNDVADFERRQPLLAKSFSIREQFDDHLAKLSATLPEENVTHDG